MSDLGLFIQRNGHYFWDAWAKKSITIKDGKIVYGFSSRDIFSLVNNGFHYETRHRGSKIERFLVANDQISAKGILLDPQRYEGVDSFWSGCTVEMKNLPGIKDGIYLYHTRTKFDESGCPRQQIALTIFDDQYNVTEDHGVILKEEDNPSYLPSAKSYDGTPGAFRDPNIVAVVSNGEFLGLDMYLSARISTIQNKWNASAGLAQSKDGIHWKLLDPVFCPCIHEEIELIQPLGIRDLQNPHNDWIFYSSYPAKTGNRFFPESTPYLFNLSTQKWYSYNLHNNCYGAAIMNIDEDGIVILNFHQKDRLLGTGGHKLFIPWNEFYVVGSNPKRYMKCDQQPII